MEGGELGDRKHDADVVAFCTHFSHTSLFVFRARILQYEVSFLGVSQSRDIDYMTDVDLHSCLYPG